MDLQSRLVGIVASLAMFVAVTPAAAIPDRTAVNAVPAIYTAPAIYYNDDSPGVVLVARDTVDLEDHSGYTSEYIFGMTKGIMRSTLTPALKPVVLLLTVPLDLAFLPFAALGGFFR